MSDTEVHGNAIYLYCLSMAEGMSVMHDMTGVDERYPVMALGDGDSETGMVAIISGVDPSEFSEHNLQTLSWLGVRAQRHEAVVDRIMGASPVLPVKFGTIFSSRASLKEFIREHGAVIVRALNDLRDKAEWSVKGYLDEAEARSLLVASDDEIQSRLAKLSPSPGARYIQQRQLDARIEAALHAWLKRAADDIQSALVLHAVASIPLRCHHGSVTGRAERMIFNASFLLADTADFRAALIEQQAAYLGSGLTLELHGPWPPYNYCPTLAGEKP